MTTQSHKLYRNLFIILSACTPSLSAAFSLTASGTTFKSIATYLFYIISLVNPLLVSAAFLLFFWGLSKFILTSGSPAEIEKGRTYMIWGIAALFILLTFKVIVGYIVGDLDINSVNPFHVLPTNIQ